MKARYHHSLSVVVFFLVFCVPSVADEWLEKPARESGEGKLYKTNGLSVAVLRGTWFEMGQQYGTLLKTEMKSLHTLTYLGLASHGLDKEQLEKGFTLMEEQMRLYPHRIREMHRGMMEGSGMTFREIALLEHYLAAQFAIKGGLFCSGMSAWGDFTMDGKMIVGRNMDIAKHYVVGCPFFTLAVLHPADGSVPTATIGYAGQIGASSVVNAAGLVAFYNVPANLLPVEQVHLERISIPVLLTLFALDCSMMEQLDATLQTYRFNFPQMCTVADAKQSWTYEVGTSRLARRAQDEPGFNTVSNWALDPIWQELLANVPPDPRQEIDPRQKHLQEQGRQSKGKIDVDEMKRILDIKVREGGATWPLNDPFEDVTLYQFVFVPETKRLSLRQPAYKPSPNWIEIDLNRLFSGFTHDVLSP
jgi:hypothetical protein